MIENVFSQYVERPIATMKLADLQPAADSHQAQHSAAAAVRFLLLTLARREEAAEAR